MKEHKIEPLGITFTSDDESYRRITVFMSMMAGMMLAVSQFRDAHDEMSSLIDDGRQNSDEFKTVIQELCNAQEIMFTGVDVYADMRDSIDNQGSIRTMSMRGVIEKMTADSTPDAPVHDLHDAPTTAQ